MSCFCSSDIQKRPLFHKELNNLSEKETCQIKHTEKYKIFELFCYIDPDFLSINVDTNFSSLTIFSLLESRKVSSHIHKIRLSVL